MVTLLLPPEALDAAPDPDLVLPLLRSTAFLDLQLIIGSITHPCLLSYPLLQFLTLVHNILSMYVGKRPCKKN